MDRCFDYDMARQGFEMVDWKDFVHKVIALTLQSEGFTCGKCQPVAASHDGSCYYKPWSSLERTSTSEGPF